MGILSKYFDFMSDLAAKLTQWLPDPFNTIFYMVLSMILFLSPLILFVAFALYGRHALYYTRTNCSVCGLPTGIKGNKRLHIEGNRRFQLADGWLCETCAAKVAPLDTDLSKCPPNRFTDFTIKKAAAFVQYHDKVGREQFVREIEAKKAEKRKQGIVCPKCGGTQISSTAGQHGSDVWITCLNCGHQWRPGQHRSW